jgi:hypothetical protein
VLVERPSNAIGFILEVIVKGDAAKAKAEEDVAAARVQAVNRGRKVRKEARKRRKDEAAHAARRQEAATKIAAVRRGKKQRSDQAQQAAAATKVQAARRGSKARDTIKRASAESAAEAAVELEAGLAEASLGYDAMEEQAAAATKVQAVRRGKAVRDRAKSAPLVKRASSPPPTIAEASAEV